MFLATAIQTGFMRLDCCLSVTCLLYYPMISSLPLRLDFPILFCRLTYKNDVKVYTCFMDQSKKLSLALVFCLFCTICAPFAFAISDKLFDSPMFDSDKSDLFNQIKRGSLFDNGAKERSETAAQKTQQAADRAARESRIKEFKREGDDRLYSQMKTVGNWIDNWIMYNHRFPEQGDEQANATNQLNMLVPNNPYQVGNLSVVAGADVNETLAETNEYAAPQPVAGETWSGNARVRLELDWSLSVGEIEEFSKEPPLTWQAPPGTITVACNNQYLFVVWGAGADGKSVRDPLTNRVRMVIANYQNWTTQPMDAQSN